MNRIFPLLSLIIAAGVFFAYVSPTWSGSIADTKATISSDDQALAAASQYVTEQNQLATASSEIDPEGLKRLAVLLPDSVDNVTLILDLNTLASQSGLLLSNVDVITDATGSGGRTSSLASGTNPLGSIDLSLSAIGSYKALQAFLAGVERSARLLDVRDLTVKSSDTGIYTYQMMLRLYWLR